MKRFFDFLFSNHYGIAFFVTLIIAAALIIVGFFTPPVAEISGSVITAAGELFLWPALALAAKTIAEGKKAQFKKGDTTFTIGNNNDETEA